MKNRKNYDDISIFEDKIRAFRFRLTENGYFWDNQGRDAIKSTGTRTMGRTSP